MGEKLKIVEVVSYHSLFQNDIDNISEQLVKIKEGSFHFNEEFQIQQKLQHTSHIFRSRIESVL